MTAVCPRCQAHLLSKAGVVLLLLWVEADVLQQQQLQRMTKILVVVLVKLRSEMRHSTSREFSWRLGIHRPETMLACLYAPVLGNDGASSRENCQVNSRWVRADRLDERHKFILIMTPSKSMCLLPSLVSPRELCGVAVFECAQILL